MKLFHTGGQEIRVPDIYMGRKNADLGPGFYLTPDEDFAGNWARERTASDIFVNVYELDTGGLDIRILDKDRDWLDIILNNRLGRGDPSGDADVVIGPVAVDTLFETYGVITSGLLSAEDSLKILSIGPEYTQAVIKTEKAASRLKWVSSYVLDEAAIKRALNAYRAVREKFDIEFAETLESVMPEDA